MNQALKETCLGVDEAICTFQIENLQLGKRHVTGRAKAVRNQAGEPIALFGISYDCTEEVERQLETDNLRRNLEFTLALAKKSEKRFSHAV